MGRIDTLLAAMTLEEKIGQLNMVAASRAITGPGEIHEVREGVRSGRIGSLLNLWGDEDVRAVQRLAVEESRLRVPLLLGLDVIHGHRTIFPVPLAEACALAPDLWERTARAAAEEAAEDGVAMTFAPMLDVARDPRWGRMVESPGEDPWVASEMATAKTRGFQGRDLAAADSLAATAKHFCAYGAVAAGREYASVDVSERSLLEIYLPPFSAAVAAGAAAVMPAFIDIAGIPMTANAPLLQGWLRDRLGFDGVIVSDYGAVRELLNHGVAGDAAEAAALALAAGVDIDMMSNAYAEGLPGALERGLVTMAAIDASVRRVLELKERLGLFDDPYQRGAPRPLADGRSPAGYRELAREAGRRAIVLLTHRNGVLPLSREATRIAVVGPLAEAAGEMLGSWASAGDADKAVAILDGLRAALPRRRIDFARGADIDSDDESGIPPAVELCAEADVVVLCLGEAAAMSGEAASRADLGLPGRQRALAEAVFAAGKPVVVLLSSGRPLALPWLFERADAVLATWFLGSEAGHAVADVLTGGIQPLRKIADKLAAPRRTGPDLLQSAAHRTASHARRSLFELLSRYAFDPAISFRSRAILQPLRALGSAMRSGPPASGRKPRGQRPGPQRQPGRGRGDAVPLRSRRRRERGASAPGTEGRPQGRARRRRTGPNDMAAQGGGPGVRRPQSRARARTRRVSNPCRTKRRPGRAPDRRH